MVTCIRRSHVSREWLADDAATLLSQQDSDEFTASRHLELATDPYLKETVINGFAEESYGNTDAVRVGKHEHLLKSGPLGKCNDPFCTTCPFLYDDHSVGFQPVKVQKTVGQIQRGTSPWYKCWGFPILNPHTKKVQQWNKFFVLSCFLGIFLDPLFFFLVSVDTNHICIWLNHQWAISFTVIRSVVDIFYLFHMLLQFRLAYKDKVTGELVDDPKLIAIKYLRGFFVVDVVTVLPLPQIMIMVVVPVLQKSSGGANYYKDMLRVTVLLQNIPRSIRFFPLLAGRSPTGFVFETAWANFVINLLIYVLAGHVVGSCWYLFGLQRVNACLQMVCTGEQSSLNCKKKYLDCGYGFHESNAVQRNWISNTSAKLKCLTVGSPILFSYGIYAPMGIQVAQDSSFVKKYIYSLFWGFLQLSTLAGNQVPSSFVWEVLFTMGIAALGLLMFALFIGNMQNFLQSLGRRQQEMQMRRYDVENWMGRRRFPNELRKCEILSPLLAPFEATALAKPALKHKRVRQAERFRWAATRGVDEKEVLSDLPEELQTEVKCFVGRDILKKVRLFDAMNDEAQVAICERLEQRLYAKESKILRRGCPVKRMYFIVRGTLSCVGEDGSEQRLSAGDFCGEELLIWHLEHPSNRFATRQRTGLSRMVGERAVSSQTVECLDSVDAFVLEANDLEYITTHYGRLISTPRIRGILRNDSPAWKAWAALRIQVAWKYRLRKARQALEAQAAAAQMTARESGTICSSMSR